MPDHDESPAACRRGTERPAAGRGRAAAQRLSPRSAPSRAASSGSASSPPSVPSPRAALSRRSALSLGALSLGALSVAGLSGCGTLDSATRPRRRVRLAADLSLTGAHADTGQAVHRALRLQIERLNNRGAVPNGDLTLSVRDNGSDPKRSVANLRRFQSDTDVHAAILGSGNDCVAKAAPVVESGNLPTISLAPLDPWSGALPPRSPLFKLAPNPGDDAAALIDLLISLHARTATVVTGPGRYGRQFIAAVRSAVDTADITLDPPVRLRQGSDHAAAGVLYQSGRAPDAVLLAVGAGRVGSLVTALHDIGYRGTIALDAASVHGEYLSDDALSDAYLVFPPILSADDQVATTPAKAAQRQWFDDYTSRFGGYRAVSGFAADAVRVLADAAAAGGTDRKRLRTAVETAEFDGLSGPVRYRPDNHSGLTPQALTTLRAHRDRWHLGR